MRLLFFVSTALEWRAACPSWTEELPEQTLLEFTSAHGRTHDLCITGVGPVNAALAAGLCLRAATAPDNPHKVDAAVNLGLAGSFDLGLAPLGSAWQVTEEIWPEYGLATRNGVDAIALGIPQWRTPDGEIIWDRLTLPTPERHPLLAALTLPAVQAKSLTVAGVTNSLELAASLRTQYNALLENMEGFALALACARHGLPLAEIRTISNRVGTRVAEDRDFPLALNALRPLLDHILKTA